MFKIGSTEIIIEIGDITEKICDAIVNAANSTLMGGGGVDGAIHRKGGKLIDQECIKIRKEKYPDGLPTGEAVITSAGNLPSKYVIHTVGPIWKGGYSNEENLLKNCYKNSLSILVERNLRTIAFPAISTGAYGYPLEKAAKASIEAIYEFLINNPGKIERICLVLFDQEAYIEFLNAFKEIFKISK
ncbi:MAG: O-acetyl-ADP-ribose deacetylase [Thermoplasmata archaeon]|nr:O-acetyl-ADP-ribose deacetylase [Thermoplasmata archaeon]